MRILAAGIVSAVLLISAGCAHNAPAGEPETAVRVAQPLKQGDCVEARRRAALEPDLAVDRLPAPVVTKPAAFRDMPYSALRKDGTAEIKIDVVIDTLGRADMKTFKVVKVSNRWFVENARGFLPKWRFSPAELAGCKVPRVYHLMATYPARTADR
jgi:hypothetical protein